MICHSIVTQLTYEDEEMILAKPMTFMNRSGVAVYELLRKYHLGCGNLIVIHDDVDFDWGTIRIKSCGGDGGHKGIRSIIESLGTNEFTRIRIGISKPTGNNETSDYVLETIEDAMWGQVPEIAERGSKAVKTVVKYGIVYAMNLFNRTH